MAIEIEAPLFPLNFCLQLLNYNKRGVMNHEEE